MRLCLDCTRVRRIIQQPDHQRIFDGQSKGWAARKCESILALWGHVKVIMCPPRFQHGFSLAAQKKSMTLRNTDNELLALRTLF